ncbi:hypothetical protein CAL7716_100350 (plasmid) [Calothrix sp. PCC 7716]|nr:hypothetical protein CAL7716_100350 [Calothrix sp. PCC 7716]
MTLEKLNEVSKELGYTIETVPLSFEIFRNKGIVQPFLFGRLNCQKRLREAASYIYEKQVGIARASDGIFVYFTLMFTIKGSYYIWLVSARLSVTEFMEGHLLNWKNGLEKQEILDASLRYDLPTVKINSKVSTTSAPCYS